MDHKEYTKVLTDLFRDCSIKAYEKKDEIKTYSYSSHVNSSENYTQKVSDMFRETSGAFNSTVAFKYVQKLKDDFPHITQKINNYPEIFWFTNQREEHIKEGFDHLIKHELSSIFSILEDNLNPVKHKKDNYNIIDEFEKGIMAVPNLLNKCEDASKQLVDNAKRFEWVNLYTEKLQEIIHKVIQVQSLFSAVDVSSIKEHINKKHEDHGLRAHLIRSIEEVEQKYLDSSALPRNKM